MIGLANSSRANPRSLVLVRLPEHTVVNFDNKTRPQQSVPRDWPPVGLQPKCIRFSMRFFCTIYPTIDTEARHPSRFVKVILFDGHSNNIFAVGFPYQHNVHKLDVVRLDYSDLVQHYSTTIPISDSQHHIWMLRISRQHEFRVRVSNGKLCLLSCFLGLYRKKWKGNRCARERCPTTQGRDPFPRANAVAFFVATVSKTYDSSVEINKRHQRPEEPESHPEYQIAFFAPKHVGTITTPSDDLARAA
jgi:hypothetical protein